MVLAPVLGSEKEEGWLFASGDFPMRGSPRMAGRTITLALIAALALPVACGTIGEVGNDDRAAGGEPEFVFTSTWEPDVHETGEGFRIGFAFEVVNEGTESGRVSCAIVFNGERLPGESDLIRLAPGEEGTVSGYAELETGSDDLPLEDLAPVCE